MAWYLRNLTPVSRQNQIAGSIPRKTFTSVTYSDWKILEFILELTANTYSNYSSMELALPIQFTKSTNKTAKMASDLITVNILFGHWIKDIDIRRYPDDTWILPTNNNVDVYQYSASQVKYLPKNAISVVEKTFLYSKNPAYLDEDVDRRSNNSADTTKRTDDNLDYRIKEFKDYLFKKSYFHVPLGFLVGLGLVIFVMKTYIKFSFTLERNMNRLFESNAKVDNIPADPDALIQVHDRPYIVYQEINLTQTFDLYLNGALRSETALRMGVLPSPYQQMFETNKGTQSLTVTFKGAQRQFE